MPLISTILWTLWHGLIALALNWIAQELKLVHCTEVMVIYFAILAARSFDTEQKFMLAYKEDPDLVESILRDQLNNDE